jgi:hypothetical protein
MLLEVERESGGDERQVEFADVYARRLSGLKYKLVSCYQLSADMVGNGIRKFVYDTDRPAFLKKGARGIWCG